MKYSSFKKDQLLFENWRKFLKEQNPDASWNPMGRDYDPPLHGPEPDIPLRRYTVVLDYKAVYPEETRDPLHKALSHAIKHFAEFKTVKSEVKNHCTKARQIIKDDWIDKGKKAFIFDEKGDEIADSSQSNIFNKYFLADEVILNTFDMINDLKLGAKTISPEQTGIYNDLYILSQKIALTYVGVLDQIKANAFHVDHTTRGAEIKKEIAADRPIYFQGEERRGQPNLYIVDFKNNIYIVLTTAAKYVTAYKPSDVVIHLRAKKVVTNNQFLNAVIAGDKKLSLPSPKTRQRRGQRSRFPQRRRRR